MLILAQGIGRGELVDGPLRALCPSGVVVPLDRAAGEPSTTPHDGSTGELSRSLPAVELRQEGLEVDRFGLILRPPWYDDGQAVDRIGRRPHGPADLTVLELRGPLHAAMTAGSGTALERAARAKLASDCARAVQLVRRGRPVHTWLIALGRPVAVAHMLDVQRWARHLVGWPFASMLRVRSGPAVACIEASGHRALDRLRAELPSSPLGGAMLRATARGLLLLAPPCTAFGRHRVFARACHAHEAAAAALLPWPQRSDLALDLASVAARVAMATAVRIAEDPRSTPAPAAAPASATTAAAALLPLDSATRDPIDRLVSDES